MQHNLDLQLQMNDTASSEARRASSSHHETRDWISAINTAVLTTQTKQAATRPDLAQLMQTPEFASLVIAAQHLANSQNISKEEAAERLIDGFRSIDRAWTEMVMRRGIQAILD
jgi:hypothetical protein